MYNNKYQNEWVVSNRSQEDFSEAEKKIMQKAKDDFNNYYNNNIGNLNHKYISEIKFYNNRVIIYFETERKLQNVLRSGNALRQYSRFLAKNGFDHFVYNHRLMRTHKD